MLLFMVMPALFGGFGNIIRFSLVIILLNVIFIFFKNKILDSAIADKQTEYIIVSIKQQYKGSYNFFV